MIPWCQLGIITNYGCRSHIESDVRRSQVLDFQILRLSTCWSSPESGFLDDMTQNLIQTWTRWGSPFEALLRFHVFLMFFVSFASQESMKSRASLKGLSSRNKRENPLLWRPQSWLDYGAIVWTSCAAQLRFCCCLTEGQQQHSFMVFGIRKGLLDSLSLREMPKKLGLFCFCTGTTQLRRCYSNGPTRQGLISEMAWHMPFVIVQYHQSFSIITNHHES